MLRAMYGLSQAFFSVARRLRSCSSRSGQCKTERSSRRRCALTSAHTTSELANRRLCQSALFEQVGVLGGLPHAPSALGGANAQPVATYQLAAANLKLYLECASAAVSAPLRRALTRAVCRYTGATLEVRSRERLQVVFSTVLTPHTGVEPDMPSIWPLVEPTVVPVRRLEVLERNKRRVFSPSRCKSTAA